MSRNERTTPPIASIAGRILASEGQTPAVMLANKRPWTLQWAELQALAASCLTQAADKTDDWGFDPRDGSDVGHEFIPKSPQVRKALRGKLGKQPKPKAKPKRRSP